MDDKKMRSALNHAFDMVEEEHREEVKAFFEDVMNYWSLRHRQLIILRNMECPACHKTSHHLTGMDKIEGGWDAKMAKVSCMHAADVTTILDSKSPPVKTKVCNFPLYITVGRLG